MRDKSYVHHTGSIAIVLLGILLGTAHPARAQVGLGLTPMRVEMHMAPGATYSGSLNLTNDSETTMRVRAELLDFYVDENDTPQFDREYAKEADFSCRKWLTVNPMEAELGAHETTLARYTIKAPAEATAAGYHCAVGFSSLPPAEKLSGTGIRTAVRVVPAFYVVVGDPTIDGGPKEIKLERIPKAPGANSNEPAPALQAVVVMENRGVTQFRPAGELLVTDEKGVVVEKDDFVSLPVLPKRDQRFLFPLKVPLTDGKYTFKVRVDIGTHEIQEASLVVESGPVQ